MCDPCGVSTECLVYSPKVGILNDPWTYLGLENCYSYSPLLYLSQEVITFPTSCNFSKRKYKMHLSQTFEVTLILVHRFIFLLLVPSLWNSALQLLVTVVSPNSNLYLLSAVRT